MKVKGKGLSLAQLKLIGKKLSRTQMLNLSGGLDLFECYCGFVGGSEERDTITLVADDINGALTEAGSYCEGKGATCTGW